MLQIRSNTSTVPVSQMHVVYSIRMTIADDMSALSERILLIVFLIIPVLISWLVLQLGFTLACLLHFASFNASSPGDCWPASFRTCYSHFCLYTR